VEFTVNPLAAAVSWEDRPHDEVVDASSSTSPGWSKIGKA
jgi:hypothetical protein